LATTGVVLNSDFTDSSNFLVIGNEIPISASASSMISEFENQALPGSLINGLAEWIIVTGTKLSSNADIWMSISTQTLY